MHSKKVSMLLYFFSCMLTSVLHYSSVCKHKYTGNCLSEKDRTTNAHPAKSRVLALLNELTVVFSLHVDLNLRRKHSGQD